MPSRPMVRHPIVFNLLGRSFDVYAFRALSEEEALAQVRLYLRHNPLETLEVGATFRVDSLVGLARGG